MIEDLSLPFVQHALLAALLAAVCCGVMGTLVVANRMVFLAGGAAHAAYGGVGLAYFLALPVLPVTIAFINAQFQAGADIVVLADHATRNLVGPHHYEQYLLPIHQEITAQTGGPIILHVCGNCSDRLELFARSGVDAYHFEWQVDSREAVRRVGEWPDLRKDVDFDPAEQRWTENRPGDHVTEHAWPLPMAAQPLGDQQADHQHQAEQGQRVDALGKRRQEEKKALQPVPRIAQVRKHRLNHLP